MPLLFDRLAALRADTVRLRGDVAQLARVIRSPDLKSQIEQIDEMLAEVEDYLTPMPSHTDALIARPRPEVSHAP